MVEKRWLRMGRLMIPPSKNMMNINQGKQHQGKRKKQTKSNVNVLPNSIQQHSTCKLFSQRHVRLLANCITKESFVATIYHSTPYEIRKVRATYGTRRTLREGHARSLHVFTCMSSLWLQLRPLLKKSPSMPIHVVDKTGTSLWQCV